jgi:hypothetical protein
MYLAVVVTDSTHNEISLLVAQSATRMSALGQKRTCASHPLCPNSDRESGFLQTVISALHPIADMCSAVADVRFGPIADMR